MQAERPCSRVPEPHAGLARWEGGRRKGREDQVSFKGSSWLVAQLPVTRPYPRGVCLRRAVSQREDQGLLKYRSLGLPKCLGAKSLGWGQESASLVAATYTLLTGG